jgi:hypothetical protein
MGATPTFDLYIDDSGSRLPDKGDRQDRRDGIDAFGLGGILVKAEEAPSIYSLVEELRSQFHLAGPLHSTKIRCRKEEFSWLQTDKTRANAFYSSIEAIIQLMPGWVTASVVHRPGYNARYEKRYGGARWRLCRTAYQILLERCAKFAKAHGRRLKVYAEETGKAEDRSMQEYHKNLLDNGAEFDQAQSAKYIPMTPHDLRKVVIRNVSFIQKKVPFAQAADLVLYPLIKGRYQPSYPPFRMLCEIKKVLDFALTGETVNCGVKYSCFDGPGFAEKLFQ